MTENKTWLILAGNNGSLPDSYYVAYRLTFYKIGKAVFEIWNGHSDDPPSLNRTGEFEEKALKALMQEIPNVSQADGPPDIGGPERLFIYEHAEQELQTPILPGDKAGNALFGRILRLFSPELPNQIDKYLQN